MRVAILFILSMFVGGCVASHQSVVEDVDVGGWSDSKSIVMNNTDTVTLRDLEIFARYIPSKASNPIKLMVTTTTPSGSSFSEEVTITLPHISERRGVSELSTFPYRGRVVWRETGEYTVELTPTSRVVGVEAVGLNITKNQPSK